MRTRHEPAGEERRAEAITVIWMLTAVATLAAETVTLVARAVMWLFADADQLPVVARILPGWFLLCATLTGLLSLALMPVVYYTRRTPPPLSISIAVAVIGLAPLVIMIAGWLW
jgi:hypothetical protein